MNDVDNIRTIALREEYPEAIFCTDMDNNSWIQIGGGKYTQLERYNIPRGIWRVWLWDNWYYFSV